MWNVPKEAAKNHENRKEPGSKDRSRSETLLHLNIKVEFSSLANKEKKIFPPPFKKK